MAATRLTLMLECLPGFYGTVVFSGVCMDRLNTIQQSSIFLLSTTYRTTGPSIKTAGADTKNRAHHPHPKRRLVSLNELVLNPDSLAKYCAAFFNMSRSSFTRANSRFRRATSSSLAGLRPCPGKASAPCELHCSCHL